MHELIYDCKKQKCLLYSFDLSLPLCFSYQYTVAHILMYCYIFNMVDLHIPNITETNLCCI